MALNDGFSINSILGIDSSVKGDVAIDGFARIDGDVDGNVYATGNVIIGKKARIRGNVTAKSVTLIGGIVLGDIDAPDFVKILAAGAVLGDIQTKRFMSEENAILNGHCIAVSDASEYEQAVRRQLAVKSAQDGRKRG